MERVARVRNWARGCGSGGKSGGGTKMGGNESGQNKVRRSSESGKVWSEERE